MSEDGSDIEVAGEVLRRFLHGEGYWSLTDDLLTTADGDTVRNSFLTIDTGIELTGPEVDAIKRLTNGRTYYKD